MRYIIILSISMGLFLSAVAIDISSREIDIYSKTIQTVQEGEIQEQIVFDQKPKSLLAKTISNGLYATSVSLMVSLMILFFVERREKQEFQGRVLELQNQINRNVFDGVFRRLLQPELFEMLKRSVILQDLIRKDAEWHYKIFTNAEGCIEFSQVISYKLENISEKILINPVKIEFTYDEYHSSVCEKMQIKSKEGEKAFTKEDLEKTLEIDSNSSAQNPVEIKLDPGEVGECTIYLHTKTQIKDYLSEIHTTDHPIIRLSVVLNIEEGLEVDMLPMFDTYNLSQNNFGTTMILKTDQAILPKQGVYFTIKRSA